MSNLLLQKIVLLRVTEVGKIILKKKRPLLLARSVFNLNIPSNIKTDDGIVWNRPVNSNSTLICLHWNQKLPMQIELIIRGGAIYHNWS